MKSIFRLLTLILMCFVIVQTFAQTRIIKGTVVDIEQKSIPGASIVVPYTSIGTATDLNGCFTLNIPTNAKSINVSFIGMITLSIPINNSNTYNIVLEESSKSLNEVVVVGYGTQKKIDLTGAVSSVDATIIQGDTKSIQLGLQGRISGVQITNSEASPDGGMSMVIRGSSSILGGTEPLYVVDGVPISGTNTMISAGDFDNFNGSTMTQPANALSFLNPADIASVEILKDASSTAIYGSRGSNGVVLITTKKGIEGKTRISFNASEDVANASKKLNLLNAAETASQYNTEQLIQSVMGNNETYAQALLDLPYPGTYSGQNSFNWTSNNNAGGDGSYRPSPEDYLNGTVPSTNWQNVVLRTAISNHYDLSLSGGSNKIQFRVGAGFDNINGIIIGSNFKRYTFDSNLDAKLLNNVSFTNSVNGSYTKSNRSQVGNVQSGDMEGVMLAAETYSPISLIGGYLYQMENGILSASDNPYITATNVIDQNITYSMIDNAVFTIDIMKGLKVKISGGARFNQDERDYYIPKTSNRFWEANGNGYASYGISPETYLINENMVFYNTTIGKNKIDITAGYTQENTSGNTHSMSATGFLNDYSTYHNLGMGTSYSAPYSTYWQTTGMSYLGRVNYNYDERYLLTASFRADASSKFGANNKWGYFPSAALAWRASQEKFLKDNKLISNLKLRLSYGETGNQAVSPYQSLSALVPGTYPNNNGGLSPTYGYGLTMPNPNLKWENTAQYDAGLDLGFFNNKLSITADIYKKITNNLLQQVTLPSCTGFSSMYENAGSISNVGAELEATYVISKSDFYWSIGGTWSTNKNKVISLGGVQSLPGLGVWGWSNYPFPIVVGHPLGEIWGYKVINNMKTWSERLNCAKDNPNMMWTADPSTGQQVYVGKLGEYDYDKDANGNMKNEVIGNTNPGFIFGLNSQMSYKNFDLSFSLAGSIGQDILNLEDAPYAATSYTIKSLADNHWIPEVTDKNGIVVLNDNGKNGNILLDPYGSDYGEATYSTMVEKGSWVKLKNVTFGYTFKFNNLKTPFSSVRPYISLDNVFCITPYSGLDPEASIYGQDATRRGVAFSEYPISFTTKVGVAVIF
jgi:TonB-linked SusC/RagA family outer membrane protein